MSVGFKIFRGLPLPPVSGWLWSWWRRNGLWRGW